jgi:hypothetical protein
VEFKERKEETSVLFIVFAKFAVLLIPRIKDIYKCIKIN